MTAPRSAGVSRQWLPEALAWFLVLVMIVGNALGQAPCLGTYAWKFDEGIYVQEAALQLQGYRLYADIWSERAPLFSWMLAAAFATFGHTVAVGRAVVLGTALAGHAVDRHLGTNSRRGLERPTRRDTDPASDGSDAPSLWYRGQNPHRAAPGRLRAGRHGAGRTVPARHARWMARRLADPLRPEHGHQLFVQTGHRANADSALPAPGSGPRARHEQAQDVAIRGTARPGLGRRDGHARPGRGALLWSPDLYHAYRRHNVRSASANTLSLCENWAMVYGYFGDDKWHLAYPWLVSLAALGWGTLWRHGNRWLGTTLVVRLALVLAALMTHTPIRRHHLYLLQRPLIVAAACAIAEGFAGLTSFRRDGWPARILTAASLAATLWCGIGLPKVVETTLGRRASTL